MKDIIEFKNIVKRFPGVVALSGVSFSIRKGEIHAITGENGAGKSTLMNLLSGTYQQDEGDIIWHGKPVKITNPADSMEFGIATVYQELKLCENLDVAENIYLGREEKKIGGTINRKAMHGKARQLLDSLGVDINARTLVKHLSVAEMQIVEIARAMQLKADLMILDEPTSSLTINETQILFKNLRRLKENGRTIIYISHRLDEVFEITDRISVLRDGKYLGTFDSDKILPKEIITLIAGRDLERELSRREAEREPSHEDIALEVKNLTRGKYFRNINFKLYKNEALGFYGLQGSGRTELMETIFGLYKPDHGEVFLANQKIRIRNPNDAIRKGFVLIPEDRRRSGIFDKMDVKDNIGIVHDEEITKWSFVQKNKVINIAAEYIKKLTIRLHSLKQMLKTLSGGNQQKVIISRYLSTKPKILLMDEPTRGIDVGAKAEIYKIMRQLKSEKGKSLIVVSSELEEIVSEADRVLVMRNGKISGEVTGENITKEKILHFAFSG
jgi:ABC-type sugar transport system ATPase subunit